MSSNSGGVSNADPGGGKSPIPSWVGAAGRNAPSLNGLVEGKVISSEPQPNCYRVALHHGGVVLCTAMEAAVNRLGGADDVASIQVGSQVLVWPLRSVSAGIILGCIPAIDGGYDPGDPKHYSEITPLEDPDHGFLQKGITDGASDTLGGQDKTPDKTIPGDRGFVGDLSQLVGLFDQLAILRGSQLSQVICSVMDDLTTIVGHQLNIFSGLGDVTVREIDGTTSLEFRASPSMEESTPAEVEKGDQPEPGWRLMILMGELGRMFSTFASIPSFSVDVPDVGVFHSFVGYGGQKLDRSLWGGGMVKTRAIAVPKRIKQTERETLPEDDPRLREGFVPGEFPTTSIRDMLAWISAGQAMAGADRRSREDEEEGGEDPDMSLPEDRDARPEGDEGRELDKDGFNLGPFKSREVDLGKDAGKERISDCDAWILTLPDGSISIRDGWASSIEMTRGHIILSPALDLIMSPGRKIFGNAPLGIHLNGHRSVEIYSAGQFRASSEGSLFLSSLNSGVLLSAHERTGAIPPRHERDEEDLQGYEREIAGVMIKSPLTYVRGDVARFSLRNSFVLHGDTEKKAVPYLDMRYSSGTLWGESTHLTTNPENGSWLSIYGSSVRMKADNVEIDGALHAERVRSAAQIQEGVILGSGWSSVRDQFSPLFTGRQVAGPDSRERRSSFYSRASNVRPVERSSRSVSLPPMDQTSPPPSSSFLFRDRWPLTTSQAGEQKTILGISRQEFSHPRPWEFFSSNRPVGERFVRDAVLPSPHWVSEAPHLGYKTERVPDPQPARRNQEGLPYPFGFLSSMESSRTNVEDDLYPKEIKSLGPRAAEKESPDPSIVIANTSGY